jgi:hypothetical protein
VVARLAQLLPNVDDLAMRNWLADCWFTQGRLVGAGLGRFRFVRRILLHLVPGLRLTFFLALQLLQACHNGRSHGKKHHGDGQRSSDDVYGSIRFTRRPKVAFAQSSICWSVVQRKRG